MTQITLPVPKIFLKSGLGCKCTLAHLVDVIVLVGGHHVPSVLQDEQVWLGQALRHLVEEVLLLRSGGWWVRSKQQKDNIRWNTEQ